MLVTWLCRRAMAKPKEPTAEANLLPPRGWSSAPLADDVWGRAADHLVKAGSGQCLLPRECTGGKDPGAETASSHQ